MIGDRIVCGISDVSIQKKLLSESKLIFKKAFEIAQGIEVARRYVSDLGDQNLANDGKDNGWYTNRNVGKDQKNRRQPWSITCYRCKENHKAEECLHKKKKKCNRCLKSGHLIHYFCSKQLNRSDCTP